MFNIGGIPTFFRGPRPIYARKLFDVQWVDIFHFIRLSFQAWNPLLHETEHQVIRSLDSLWSPDQTLVSLSVRTSFDLLLQACAFPPGSEILISAITIPDMPRVIRAHGLVPVPVDLQPDSSIAVSNIRPLITSRTKLILVAQLFGLRHDLGEIAELVKGTDILLVEDCAQAFVGRTFIGSPDVHVSLFSFGPIKTCTAFGGALCTIRQPALLRNMQALQTNYPRQRITSFLSKVVKYAVFKIITDSSFIYGMFIAALRLSGKDHHIVITHLSHSLRSNRSFLAQIRLRPSGGLLRSLRHRIRSFKSRRLEDRDFRASMFASSLPSSLQPVGYLEEEKFSRHYWIFPVRSKSPRRVLDSLLEAGFDAASGSASLSVVEYSGPQITTPTARQMLESIVYLPIDHQLSTRAQDRLARALIGYD